MLVSLSVHDNEVGEGVIAILFFSLTETQQQIVNMRVIENQLTTNYKGALVRISSRDWKTDESYNLFLISAFVIERDRVINLVVVSTWLK